jgi:hypothetical protein
LQIDCPVCQRPIIVRRAPRSLRTAGWVALSILVVVGIVLLAVHLFAGARTLRFKAFVDGTDIIKLSGRKLWIEHQEWRLPARMLINGKKWDPAWNGKTSMPYDLSTTFHPRLESIKLIKLAGRGPISIVEMPGADNDETLSIQVDDGNEGGADWYEFTVSW